MNATKRTKTAREYVCGSPVVCYDNGGKTCDRYTVVYLSFPEGHRGLYSARAMNERPFHPQGFGQSTSCAYPIRTIGRRIPFSFLPEDCQKLVKQDLCS
jgi:hypothetical protein